MTYNIFHWIDNFYGLDYFCSFSNASKKNFKNWKISGFALLLLDYLFLEKRRHSSQIGNWSQNNLTAQIPHQTGKNVNNNQVLQYAIRELNVQVFEQDHESHSIYKYPQYKDWKITVNYLPLLPECFMELHCKKPEQSNSD